MPAGDGGHIIRPVHVLVHVPRLTCFGYLGWLLSASDYALQDGKFMSWREIRIARCHYDSFEQRNIYVAQATGEHL
jgi:hypothetical protein